jgi:hypothetical protein
MHSSVVVPCRLRQRRTLMCGSGCNHVRFWCFRSSNATLERLYKETQVYLNVQDITRKRTDSVRAVLPLTSDVAASRWELCATSGGSSLELDDTGLLSWITQNSHAPEVLRAAVCRRPYEARWLPVQQSAARVLAERGEVLGARIGCLVAAFLAPLSVLLAFGGSALHAVLLLLVLAAGGAAGLPRRGTEVLPRVLIVQVFAALALIGTEAGIWGAIVALYASALLMAGFTTFGSRVGGILGRLAFKRLRRHFVAPASGSEERVHQSAVAA